MATNANAAAATPADPTVAPNSKKKLFIIIGAVVVLAIAAGAGWFLTKGKSKGGEHANDEEHPAEVAHVKPKPPMFIAIEPFTVNLKKEFQDSNDQYMQIGISLKFFVPTLEAQIKTSQPEIRSKILQLLTTKTAKELLTAEGKNKLIREIVAMSNNILAIVEPPPRIRMVPAPVVMPAVAAEPVPGAEEQPESPPPEPVMMSVVVPWAQHEKQGIVDVLFTSFIIQ